MSKFDDVLKKYSLSEESFTDNDLKEMGTNDARSLKDNEEWVKVLQTGSYQQFKDREDTQLNSSQYKKYRKAAVAELVKHGVLDKSFIKEADDFEDNSEKLTEANTNVNISALVTKAREVGKLANETFVEAESLYNKAKELNKSLGANSNLPMMDIESIKHQSEDAFNSAKRAYNNLQNVEKAWVK